MFTFTHVSNVAKVDAAGNPVLVNGKKAMDAVETPGVTVPTTADDIRKLLDDPKWTEATTVTLGGTKVSTIRLAKLIADSIKLEVNGRATSKMRQGSGIDVDATLAKIVTQMFADPQTANEWRERYTAALTSTDTKKTKRALCEEWIASLEV